MARPTVKFSIEDVRAIRRALEGKTASPQQLAQFYGCSTETIRRIARRETWAWLDAEAPRTEEELATAAAASLEKLNAMLATNPPPPDASKLMEEMSGSVADQASLFLGGKRDGK